MKKQTNQRKKNNFKLNKTQHNSVALRYAKWNLQSEHAIVREWQDRRTHTTSIIRKKVLTLTFTMKTYTCHSFLTLYIASNRRFDFFFRFFFFLLDRRRLFFMHLIHVIWISFTEIVYENKRRAFPFVVGLFISK